tara:strand:- start:817 stop:1590 length:774 start_codon:yes stop_codon:yes gene_type:complete
MKKQAALSVFAALTVAAVIFSYWDKDDSHADKTAVHWGYTGENGPDKWGDLSPEFRLCKEGLKQSPINIAGARPAKLPVIQIDYKEVPLKVLNNGHTIQVNYPAGSTMTVGNETFQFAQIHFHTPSEHTVDGKPFAMGAHLVHKKSDGTLAVLGIFMKEGKENPFIAGIWKHMPTEAGKTATPDAVVDVAGFLPSDLGYFNYSGSLTTPPGTEGVQWRVLKTPVEVSRDQITKFAGLIKANARPIQTLNGREILVSE